MYNFYGDKMNDMEKTEIINFENKTRVKKTEKRIDKKMNRKYIIFRLIPILLLPILIDLTIISTHSDRLIFSPISYIIYILVALLVYLLIYSFFSVKRKKRKRSKGKKIAIILTRFFIFLYVLGCFSFVFLLYGPYSTFRDWLISTAMSTMNHQYLCKWFYSDKEIEKSVKGNYIIEVNENTNPDLIKVEVKETYENKYEEQILKRDKYQKYKIIELTVNGQKAYLAAIYDPSKVKVTVTSALGRYGQYVTKMAEDKNAILAVNGGGFYDPGNNSTGGMPTGVTIVNGKIITNNNYSSYTQSGGLIGMTYDNKLVMIKNATGNKALSMGVRDGVSWGPFLIVNGKKAFIKGNGGWGYAARTAIGQRSDGIILLLVVNSNSTRTKGADMVDLTEIMEKYGAVNAANLDGGTSTVMVLPKKEALKYIPSCDKNYCYINDPIDSILRHRTRGIASSIIVTK